MKIALKNVLTVPVAIFAFMPALTLHTARNCRVLALTLLALLPAVAGASDGKTAATCRKTAMERLPPGSIRPHGWLRRQLELQRDGLTGHAEELYLDIGKSDWLTGGTNGGQFAWERGPYYAKGLTSLAFALDDAVLKERAKRRIEAYLASQRTDGDFGPKKRSWWANMIVLWTLRDWCEATGDQRVIPFMKRYFTFQRDVFAKGAGFINDSTWAVARVGDQLDVVLWLYRKSGDPQWLEFARTVAAQSADWTKYYHIGGYGGWGPSGFRSHIVNFMQGLKTPPLKWLLSGCEKDRLAYRAALAPEGWAMQMHGRPDRTINGSETLSGISSTEGTELCATAEHILSAQVALEVFGDADVADDMEIAAYNTLPATLSHDGKGMRYYCLLNQPACVNKSLRYRNNYHGMLANAPGPYSGFGCCRSNFHFAWPKFTESMWMKRKDGLAAVAYGDCTVRTSLATITSSGGYPFADDVTLTVDSAVGGEWPLSLRIPGWCVQASVTVNGEPFKGDAVPGSFAEIRREWKKGDTVRISFHLKTAVSRWKDDSLAVTRGPLLYALKIKAKETTVNLKSFPKMAKDAAGVLRGDELGFPTKELHPDSPWNYALVTDPSGQPSFEIRGIGTEKRLAVKAVRTGYAGWGHMRFDASGRAEDPPPSPVPPSAIDGAEETIELVPIALTQLRIALFPWAVRK